MDKNLRSDEIRDLVYDWSEGDQLADNQDDILSSDEDAYSDNEDGDSDNELDSFANSYFDSTNTEDVLSLPSTHSPEPEELQPTLPVSTHECPLCTWYHANNFEPNDFVFDSSNCGLQLDLNDENVKELDFFHELFDFDLVSHIAQETNKYASQLSDVDTGLKQFSKLRRWVNTNPDELYCFLGVVLLMPHVKKNGLKLYWSTDPLLSTPIFSQIFSQDRFLLLLRALHLDDNSLVTGRDKLYKIRTVIETIRRKFSSSFVPNQSLVIDESLMLWKGRLSFKQYIPNKRKRFGIKLYVLCDNNSGIVLDFLVYTGKNTMVGSEVDDIGASAKVVRTLIQPYLGRNHVLYLDNWYSSPDLYEWLLENQTGACGTVRTNRKNLPCLPKKMKKGDCEVRSKKHMLCVKWCDRRQVTMLTTVHKHEMVPVTKFGKTTEKPSCVVEYNKGMGAVDKTDMVMSFNDSTRKTTKWYRKLFFHIVDIVVLNSFQMFSIQKGKKTSFCDFRINLIRQIFEVHFPHREGRAIVPAPRVARPSAVTGDNHPLRLTGRHFPRPLKTPEGQTRKLQKRCYVCSHTSRKEKKRKDTTFECCECNVALCVYPCFEEFHTLKKF